jgi:endonuclease/exonuclease/phosphatase family metal-dependent hydrolase
MDSVSWTIIGMYDPQNDVRKLQLMQELRLIKTTANSRWVLLGDFNLIYRASDKNNPNVNRRLMNQFRLVLEDLKLKELQLHGHRFTWSSGTTNPTLTKIDHVFITKEWELAFSNCYLQALSTSVSDHCPLLITCTPFNRKYQGF